MFAFHELLARALVAIEAKRRPLTSYVAIVRAHKQVRQLHISDMAQRDTSVPDGHQPSVNAVSLPSTSAFAAAQDVRAEPSLLQKSLSPQPFKLPSFAVALLRHAQSAWGKSFVHPFVTGLENGTLPAAKFKRYMMQDARYLSAFGDACAIVSSKVDAARPAEKMWFLKGAITAHEVEVSLHLQYGKQLGFGPADVAAVELSPGARAYTDHMLRNAALEPLVVAIAALAPCPWLYSDLGITTMKRLQAAAGGSSSGAAAVPASPLVPPGHPYAAWIETYANDGFVSYVREQLDWLSEHAVEAGWGPGLVAQFPSSQDAATATTGTAAAAVGSVDDQLEAFDFNRLPPGHVFRRAADAFLAATRYEWMFWEAAWNDERYAWPV